MELLNIDVTQYGEIEGIADNIQYSLSLGLQELQMAPCTNSGSFVVVGSGPSLELQINNIKAAQQEGGTICAVNGAHDYLIEHGITPNLFLTVDPRGMPQNLKHANDQTVYLLASRAAISDFKLLEDKKTILWHSWSENDPEPDPKKMYIGGGSTSGLRAINVGYVLGFRDFVLYGMDSCLGERGEKRVGEEKLKRSTIKKDVIVGDRTFICNVAMAAQAQDFQGVFDVMPDITLEVRGGGLLSAIMDERKRLGY